MGTFVGWKALEDWPNIGFAPARNAIAVVFYSNFFTSVHLHHEYSFLLLPDAFNLAICLIELNQSPD
jgi:hypothetical protein